MDDALPFSSPLTGPPPYSYPPLTASSPEGISYSTAISAIIACPYKLRSGEEARALHKVCSAVPFISTRILIIPFGQVGEKLAIKVDEFLNTGHIREAGEQSSVPQTRLALTLHLPPDDLAHNDRYQAIKSLMTVHGVGHHSAKELYSLGYRSAEDLRKSGKWEKEFKYHDDIQLP